MSETWAVERSRSCLLHVVGSDGRNCRHCGLSAAWIEEGNLRRGSSYRVPGATPRIRVMQYGVLHVLLSGQSMNGNHGWVDVGEVLHV